MDSEKPTRIGAVGQGLLLSWIIIVHVVYFKPFVPYLSEAIDVIVKLVCSG